MVERPRLTVCDEEEAVLMRDSERVSSMREEAVETALGEVAFSEPG